jgi:hypothetical protein
MTHITGSSSVIHFVMMAVEWDIPEGKSTQILSDWKLLKLLNGLIESKKVKRVTETAPPANRDSILENLTASSNEVRENLDRFGILFKVPEIENYDVLRPVKDT